MEWLFALYTLNEKVSTILCIKSKILTILNVILGAVQFQMKGYKEAMKQSNSSTITNAISILTMSSLCYQIYLYPNNSFQFSHLHCPKTMCTWRYFLDGAYFKREKKGQEAGRGELNPLRQYLRMSKSQFLFI